MQCVPPGAYYARLVLTTACPVREVTCDGSVLPTSRSLATDLRRYRRRLEAMGVTFTWTPPEQMTPDAVDLLFALHASSRSRRGGSSFTPDLHAAFLRRLIAAGRPGCGPIMAIASHNGRPIGINYGFVWRDTFYGYQGGWDSSYAKLRLGTVLKGRDDPARPNEWVPLDRFPARRRAPQVLVERRTSLTRRGCCHAARAAGSSNGSTNSRADQAREARHTNDLRPHTDANPVGDPGARPNHANVRRKLGSVKGQHSPGDALVRKSLGSPLSRHRSLPMEHR